MNQALPLSSLLIKHWKFIAICVLVSLVTGYVITKMIPKKYLSYAEVYANVSNSIEDAVNKPEFGYEIHADRLIQLLESQTIKDSVVQKFALYDYYDLDSSDARDQYEVYEKLSEDIKFTRNPKMAIIISAEMRDPELSANIVNYIIDIVDPLQQEILKLNTKKAVTFYESEFLHQKRKVDSLMNVIYTIEPDSSENDPLLNSRLARWEAAMDDPGNPMRNQMVYLSVQPISMKDEITINNYLFELDRLKDFRQKMTNAQNRIKEPLASINVISRAKPVYRSTYPSMIVNLLLSLSIGLVAAILIIIFRAKLEQIKDLKA